MNRPLVYIAGPYTRPDPVENTHKAIRAAEEVEALGADVVIPHLSLLWHIVSPAPLEAWYERDLAVMRRCDAVVRLPGDSTGADNEVKEFAGPVFLWPEGRDLLRDWIAGPVTAEESPLAEADRIVSTDRNEDYGHPFDNFTQTGRMWGAILGVPDIDPGLVAMCMVAVKISRESHSPKRDNVVDGVGYFKTLHMIRQRQSEPTPE